MAIKIYLEGEGSGLRFADEGEPQKLSANSIKLMRRLSLLARQISVFAHEDEKPLLIHELVKEGNSALGLPRPSEAVIENINALEVRFRTSAEKKRDQQFSARLKSSLMIFLAGVAMSAIWCISFLPIEYDGFVQDVLNWIGVVGFGLIGIVIGVVLKLLLTGRFLDFESLEALRWYGYRSRDYFLLLFLLSAVLLVFLLSGIIDISLGDEVHLSATPNRPYYAAIIGFICSFSEAAVSTMISKRVDNVVRDVG